MTKTRKKVLIISYYWPPCGGIGVLRCLKIAKYLWQYGWQPIIYTAEDAHYPNLDETNFKDIPEKLTVLKHKIWEPYHIYKFITRQKKEANVNNVFYTKENKMGWAHQFSVWIRSNFFIPDARSMWVNPSVKFLLKYLEDHPVDAIFSNGPPHTNTRIATILKQKTGIPWLADFQDPWTQVDYYQLLNLTAWGDRKHRRLEQEAFKAADKTTIVSHHWKRDLETIGAKNVSVIPWGYDPDDYKELVQDVDRKFVLTHIGIMGYDRNPKTLFKVLQALKIEYPSLAEDLEVRLVGQVDYSVVAAYEECGLAKQVNLLGSVNRVKALEAIASSPILLLLLNQQANAKGRIPGKLFEYLAVRRTILSLGPEYSDVAQIIARSNSGYSCDYDAYEKLKAIITQLYKAYQHGQLNTPIDSDIDAYSIEKLTGEIAGFLDEITVRKK